MDIYIFEQVRSVERYGRASGWPLGGASGDDCTACSALRPGLCCWSHDLCSCGRYYSRGTDMVSEIKLFSECKS